MKTLIFILLFPTLLFAGDGIPPTERETLTLLSGDNLTFLSGGDVHYRANIIEIGAGETYTSVTAYLATGVYCLGDIFRFTGNVTYNENITVDGGTGHDTFTIDGEQYTLTCAPCAFAGDNWQLYNLRIDGDYEISGNNVTQKRGGSIP